MTYEKQAINKMNNKDKRISWLSIFSSLCTSRSGVMNELADPKELAKIAYDLNATLNIKYPDDGNPETSYYVGTDNTPKGF